MTTRDEVERFAVYWADAFNRRDMDRLADTYTDGSIYMREGLPTVKGKADIAEMFSGSQSGPVRFEVAEMLLEGGDLIVDVGRWISNEEGSAEESGRYAVVYQRQADGTLKILVDVPLD